tara:strand:+ start:2464 stop:3159 length:696 start_codon:yes stop_codon:yes gene_type:complete
MKNILRKIIIETDTKQGKVFEVLIQSLIVLSLLSFSFETLPNLGEKYKVLLSSFKFICVVFFSIEYILRVWLTKPSKAYIFSFFGIIDLLAIIPFYFASGIDLRSIRIFRLFRILKFFKFSSAMDRLIEAFIAIKNELIIFGVGTIFLIYVSSVGIYYFENPVQPQVFKSVFHSLWWAVTTLTTVGYGDMYPITIGGKVFTTIIVFIGMGMVAVPTGLLASSLSKTISSKK